MKTMKQYSSDILAVFITVLIHPLLWSVNFGDFFEFAFLHIAGFVILVSVARRLAKQSDHPLRTELIASGVYFLVGVVTLFSVDMLSTIWQGAYIHQKQFVFFDLVAVGVAALLTVGLSVFCKRVCVKWKAFITQAKNQKLVWGVIATLFVVLTQVWIALWCFGYGVKIRSFETVQLMLFEAISFSFLYFFTVLYDALRKHAHNRVLFSVIAVLGNGLSILLWLVTMHNSGINLYSALGMFMTLLGLLLYDLGCFVVRQIGKKLAEKKQSADDAAV